jgi:hypothetical protein
MIDIYRDAVRLATHQWSLFLRSPAGIYLYSLVTGIMGIAILLFFSAMVFSAEAVDMLLPLIVAFNSASSGFALIDRAAEPLQSTYALRLFILAILLAVTGLLGFFFLIPIIQAGILLHYIMVPALSLTAAFIGAWLAKKTNTNPVFQHDNDNKKEE